MVSVIGFLIVGAFVMTLTSAGYGKPPLWVAVLLLAIIALLQILPLR